MNLKLEPMKNGVILKNEDKTVNFEVNLTESIDLSNIVAWLSNIYEPIEVDYEVFTVYSKNNMADDNYTELVALGRIITTLFIAHKKTIDEQREISI